MITEDSKPPRQRILSIRLTAADCELLERLQARTRLTTISEVTRQGWRALAEKENVLKKPRFPGSPLTWGRKIKKQRKEK